MQAADPAVVMAHALTRIESRDIPRHTDSESIPPQSAKKVLISAVISSLATAQSRTPDQENG